MCEDKCACVCVYYTLVNLQLRCLVKKKQLRCLHPTDDCNVALFERGIKVYLFAVHARSMNAVHRVALQSQNVAFSVS